MKAPPLAKNYKCLTPEERFRLILAASGRGDEAERDRLKNAGGRITLSLQDHAPYAQAFGDLALLIFIELLEEAASYQEGFLMAPTTPATTSAPMRPKKKATTGRKKRAHWPIKALRKKTQAKSLSVFGPLTSPLLPVICCGRERMAGSYSASG